MSSFYTLFYTTRFKIVKKIKGVLVHITAKDPGKSQFPKVGNNGFDSVLVIIEF